MERDQARKLLEEKFLEVAEDSYDQGVRDAMASLLEVGVIAQDLHDRIITGLIAAKS